MTVFSMIRTLSGWLFREVRLRIRQRHAVFSSLGTIVGLMLVFSGHESIGEHRASADAADSLGVTLQDIVEVWEERRDRIQTVQIEWAGDVTYGKETLFWSPTRVKMYGGDPTRLPLVPESDMTYRTRGGLTWDRRHERFKLQHNTPTWNSETGRHFQQAFIHKSDPHQSVFFFGEGKDTPEDSLMRGYIRDTPRKGLPDSIELALLVTSLFPVGERLSPVKHEDEWKLLDRQIYVDGIPCLVLEKRLSNLSRVRVNAERCQLLVVNPVLNFCVVRHTNQDGDTVHWQRQFTYTRDEQYGWLPSQWTSLIAVENGQLHQRIEHSVTRFTVNQDLSEEQLKVNFPVDTWVTDETTGDEWIVRPNGERRRIARSELERGATRAELIAAETNSGRISLARWSQIGIVGSAVCAGCVYFILRTKTRSS